MIVRYRAAVDGRNGHDQTHHCPDASKAVEQAHLRMAASEDRVTAAEFRAQAAETEALEAKHALALVEETIRSRFPIASPKAVTRSNAVA
jgi:hypothetical protein